MNFMRHMTCIPLQFHGLEAIIALWRSAPSQPVLVVAAKFLSVRPSAFSFLLNTFRPDPLQAASLLPVHSGSANSCCCCR